MNRIQLIGRLGRDPEGGQGPAGPYASFSLATHEHWMDRHTGETVEHSEWHRLVCFNRWADIALEFLVKGDKGASFTFPGTTYAFLGALMPLLKA
jgi:single-strand DNA-binding protein